MKNLIITIAMIAAAYLLFTFLEDKKQTTPVSQPVEQALAPSRAEVKRPDALNALISRSPDNAQVFIMEPGDGTTLSSPLTVKFGISNMTVAPAGENTPNSGHHHLLIDLDELPDLTLPLPASDQIIHFGGGQTATAINLEPGTHTLQLLLGNYLHIPHDKPVLSKKITITIE